MKINISQSMIDNAKQGDIIASGIFKNSPEEVYLTNDKNARVFVRWVAVRWHIADWVIYTEWLFTNEFNEEDISNHRTDNSIASFWDKLSLYRVDKICILDDEARASYRE